MNKFKAFLLSAVVTLLLTSLAIGFMSRRCNCKEFRKFETITVYPDNTFGSKTDSICIVGNNPDGSIFLKKFK